MIFPSIYRQTPEVSVIVLAVPLLPLLNDSFPPPFLISGSTNPSCPSALYAGKGLYPLREGIDKALRHC
jgi:hypothetical protein